MATSTLRASLFFPPFPVSQPPLPTVSHLGPGSIHPDGGFIFVFVCLLIHASSYSGHRRGFRSTTECKSPRRLIHFHLSLVDIQLLSTFPPQSPAVKASLFLPGYGIRPAVTRPARLPHLSLLHACQTQCTSHLPPTFPVFKTSCPPSTFSLLPPPPDPGAARGLVARGK